MAKKIVDVQGFKTLDNEFIFKEVCIVALEEDAQPTTLTFKAPFAFADLTHRSKCEALWLEKNFDGILWKSGDIPYTDVEKTLREILDNSDIYVKGLEKTKWLQRILPLTSVLNIESWGCPSLKSLPMEVRPCTNHVACGYPVCAYQNASAMKSWMLKQKKLNDSVMSMYM